MSSCFNEPEPIASSLHIEDRYS